MDAKKTIQKNTIMKTIFYLILFSTILLSCSKNKDQILINDADLNQDTINLTKHNIYAGRYYYNPSELTINIGDTVFWINDGGFHDVNASINTLTNEQYNNPESFNSLGNGNKGDTIYFHIFTILGTYNYDCSVGDHAQQGMVASILVQ